MNLPRMKRLVLPVSLALVSFAILEYGQYRSTNVNMRVDPPAGGVIRMRAAEKPAAEVSTPAPPAVVPMTSANADRDSLYRQAVLAAAQRATAQKEIDAVALQQQGEAATAELLRHPDRLKPYAPNSPVSPTGATVIYVAGGVK